MQRGFEFIELYKKGAVLECWLNRPQARNAISTAVEEEWEDVLVASFTLSPHLSGHSFSPPLGPPIYPRSVSRNRRPFQTEDGAICVAPYTDKAWRSFLQLIDREELLDDPRYCNPFVRAQHLDDLYRMMTPILATKTSVAWLALLEASDVPCSPVQTTADLVADPALRRAGVLSEQEHPTEGRLCLLSNPVRFSNAPSRIHRLPPNLGEHSAEVLREAGFDEDHVLRMQECGATRQFGGATPIETASVPAAEMG